ncbi:MAG: hypothetical protein AAFR61_08815, partial [Bacteroidota bacterium]
MASALEKPLILTAYALEEGATEASLQARREGKGLAKLLLPFSQGTPRSFMHFEEETALSKGELFSQTEIRQHLTILHLIGPVPEKPELRLWGPSGVKTYPFKEFSQAIRQCQPLKMVWLSGPVHPELVLNLLSMGVPSVVTLAPQEGSSDYALGFYDQLLRGKNFHRAFADLKEWFEVDFPLAPAPASGQANLQGDRLHRGLWVRSDKLQVLESRLRNPLRIPLGEKNQSRKKLDELVSESDFLPKSVAIPPPVETPPSFIDRLAQIEAEKQKMKEAEAKLKEEEARLARKEAALKDAEQQTKIPVTPDPKLTPPAVKKEEPVKPILPQAKDKVVPPVIKQEEPKPIEKKEPLKPVLPQAKEKMGPPVVKQEEPKPIEKKEPLKPVLPQAKDKVVPPVIKQEEPKPIEKKEPLKPV